MRICPPVFRVLMVGFLDAVLGAGIALGCPFCDQGGFYYEDGLNLSVADVTAGKVPASSLPPPPAIPAIAIPPAPLSPPAFPAVKKGADGFWRVGFEHLASFTFTAPTDPAAIPPGSVEKIPANVRALDGKRVCVSGYMLPLKMENGLVREFLLIRSPMVSCYGVVPAPNEWVVVKMKGKPTVTMMAVPLNFYGTLHIGAVYENEMFSGLYALEGEKVSVN